MAVATLDRTTHATSRLLEFFSEKELTMQIGFPRQMWAVALCKELIDNALDACESTGVPPSIQVTAEPHLISVQDNGPGLPLATLDGVRDYSKRVSDKAYYVSPTRGSLGNALKACLAAPYVLSGDRQQGRVDITTGGVTYEITIALNKIKQHPEIDLHPTPDDFVKNGTKITLYWETPSSCSWPRADIDFYKIQELVQHYVLFNPHASFRLSGGGGEEATPVDWPAVDPEWAKWRPDYSTSPHWYTADTLQALLFAHVRTEHRRVQTLREFVAEFAGLKGTGQHAVVAAAGLAKGTRVDDLVVDDDIPLGTVQALLQAMQAAARPIQPPRLGVLGEAPLRTFLREQDGCAPESIAYQKKTGMTPEGVPYVVEVAEGVLDARAEDADEETDEDRHTGPRRRLWIGTNWTPVLKPEEFFARYLGENRISLFDPVSVILHLVCPRLAAVDRGKTAFAVPDAIEEAIESALTSVSKQWMALKRHADRQDRVSQRARAEALQRQRRTLMSPKRAAWSVMEEAYNAASDQGRLVANARQIMYKARPRILQLTGGRSWARSSQFTQHYLPDFLEAHPQLTAAWDVVFDARGHLREPHTGRRVDLGTVEVRNYIRDWQAQIDEGRPSGGMIRHDVETCGPANRYRAALFLEKEGFNPLIEQAQIAERFDLTILSTKGMTVTAARTLIDQLSRQGVTIFVLRDFDKSGFSIVHTMSHDTRRFRYQIPPTVIDLGLRLADVRAMGLESERVDYKCHVDPKHNLRRSGATEEECAFLVRGRDPGTGWWRGERVELNAMSSPQMIAWLEGKLREHGVEKLIPDEATLAKVYRHQVLCWQLQQAVDAAAAALPAPASVPVPENLGAHVRERITDTTQSWDGALSDLVWQTQEET